MDLRWAKSRDSCRRIVSKSYRRDWNHRRSLVVISLGERLRGNTIRGNRPERF